MNRKLHLALNNPRAVFKIKMIVETAGIVSREGSCWMCKRRLWPTFSTRNSMANHGMKGMTTQTDPVPSVGNISVNVLSMKGGKRCLLVPRHAPWDA
jgi:hypothetical protein